MAVQVQKINQLTTVQEAPEGSKLMLINSDGSYNLISSDGLSATGSGITPAYIVGNTLYAAGWLSDEADGTAIDPTENADDVYRIMTDGDFKDMLYTWDGTRYVIVSEMNSLHRAAAYSVGDVVTAPTLPSWAVLECVTAGTTGSSEPDFSNVDGGGGSIPTLQEQIDDIDDKVPFAFGKVGNKYGYYKDGQETLTEFGTGSGGGGTALFIDGDGYISIDYEKVPVVED